MKNAKEFYKNYGKVVYALCDVDGTVRKQEKKALYDYVLKFLALHEHENDSSGMNLAFYADFEFDKMEKEHTGIESAVEHFVKFVHNQHDVTDAELITRAIKGLEIVAASFKGVNKVERDFIARVNSEMKEVKFA